jgi:hypothetical protein
MKTRICISGILGLALASTGFAQAWATAYDTGLKAAKAGNWAEARKAFQQAKSNRPEDVAGATMLPGPVTEQRKWRGGAPYSPNFLSAYCLYREGLGVKDRQDSLKKAAEEFESLVAKKQAGRETVYFLGVTYGKLGANDKRQALSSKELNGGWKVDTEAVSPEELAQIGSAASSSSSGPGIVQVVDAGQLGGVQQAPANTAAGIVPIASKKFALIIANGENKLGGFQLAHAAEDARLMRDSITASAGYDPANVEVVINATAEQIKKVATALASRMPQEGTLFLFFTGAGTNIEGKDYLAGVDTEIVTDTSTMLAKIDLYKPFVEKGTSVFSFYQVPRPVFNGRFFGSEEPRFGRVSQMQSTTPGESVYAVFKDGKTTGVFAAAMSQVFSELHSNAIPITEFGWQVFYKIRRGGTGDSGGGSRQTPTLPVLLLLASNARF